MLRILKDCILSGIQAHAGEIYPDADFREQDIQIVFGLGFAERFTPAEKPEEPEDAVPEEPEDFTVSPVPCANEVERTSAVQAPPAARPASGQKKKAKKK